MFRSLALALALATTANAFVVPATGVTIAAKASTVSAPVISMGAKTLKKPLKKKVLKKKVVKKAKKVVGGSRLGAPLDTAFDPVQLSKAIGLLGDVKDGFGLATPPRPLQQENSLATECILHGAHRKLLVHDDVLGVRT